MSDARRPHVRASFQFTLSIIAVTAALVTGLLSPTPSLALATPNAAASAPVSQAGLGSGAETSIVKTSLAGFDPGNIISDSVFTDDSTMTASGIQNFLNGKVTTCRSGYTCLKDLKVSTQTKAADRLCSTYSGSSSESAAAIIYKVAKACDINPQVLIVMLQKEQGLVTHTWPSDWRYNAAMGQACPDTAPCDVAFAGFFAQVYGAARQMQLYMEGIYFTWYAPGNTWNILFHPNPECGRAPVHIVNKATSALYYYTPYQPNAAALRAGYAEGDSCSSYGNRNFYNYFTDWFGSTQNAQCAQPRGGTRSADYKYVVTGAAVDAQLAPRDACTDDLLRLKTGDIIQGIVISGSSDWLKVVTEKGERWVPRDQVRRATQAESACLSPLGTSSAKLVYLVTTLTSGRISPRTGCELEAAPIYAGSIVQATTVDKSRLWVKVVTPAGEVWIDRADTRTAKGDEWNCVYPTEATSAQYSYVLTEDAEQHMAPEPACAQSTPALKSGMTLRAVDAVDGWLRVLTGWGATWIDRSNTRRASTAEAQCALPAGLRTAKKQYVPDVGITGHAAPDADCADTTAVPASSVLQATAVTDGGDWLRVQLDGGSKWVARDDVRYATVAETQCPRPESPVTARYSYVMTESTAGRTGPGIGCTEKKTLTKGTAFQAVAAVDGWLKLAVGDAQLWVDRSDTRRATTTETACISPASPKPAKMTYIVVSGTTARQAPSENCATNLKSVARGAVFTAEAVSTDGKWLRTTIADDQVWIERADTDGYTEGQSACIAVAPGVDAKLWYRASSAMTGRSVPNSDCGYGAVDIAAGAVFQATAVSQDGSWLRVLIDGVEKWVVRDALARVTTKQTTAALNMRSGPSLDHEVIVTLPSGTWIAVLAEDGIWRQVQTQSGKGWVSSEYLR